MIVIINFCGPRCYVCRDATIASSELGIKVEVFRGRLDKGWFYDGGYLVLRGEYIKSKRGGK